MASAVNCYDAAVAEAVAAGGEVWRGWAVAPDGRRYQHCWVVRRGADLLPTVVDPMGWSQHEPFGLVHDVRLGHECGGDEEDDNEKEGAYSG